MAFDDARGANLDAQWVAAEFRREREFIHLGGDRQVGAAADLFEPFASGTDLKPAE